MHEQVTQHIVDWLWLLPVGVLTWIGKWMRASAREGKTTAEALSSIAKDLAVFATEFRASKERQDEHAERLDDHDDKLSHHGERIVALEAVRGRTK